MMGADRAQNRYRVGGAGAEYAPTMWLSVAYYTIRYTEIHQNTIKKTSVLGAK